MENGILQEGKVLVFGHRGFSDAAPENTMASFSMCRELGIPGVELDVHICASGEIVVAHDFLLKRTTGEDGTIEQWNLQDLKKLDFGAFKGDRFRDQRIPLLDEVFEEFGSDFIYDIEIKSQSKLGGPELVRKTWNIIRSHRLEGSVTASSFNPFSLRIFNRECRRSVPTADIYAVDQAVPKPLQHGFGRHISHSSYLKPELSQVDQAFMDRYHSKLGYPIVTWTVNTEQQARRLIALGVNGLVGNDPQMLLRCVNQEKAK